MSEIEKSEEYIKGVMGTLKGRPDAECIEMLREKVEFWHSSARFWRKGFLEVSDEEFWWGNC
jgi:hypothetical protein